MPAYDRLMVHARPDPLPPIDLLTPGPAERPSWERLFVAYAAFYKVAITPESIAVTWNWIRDPAHPVTAVVARRGEGLVGLAHYRAMPNPLRGIEYGFLDDLFVDPAARGQGVAEALIGHIAEVARARGWQKIRWHTKDDNYRARAFYDRIAAKTPWTVYERVA